MNEQILSLAKHLGASDISFADVRGHNDQNLTAAVSVFIRLCDGIINEIGSEPTYAYYAHYKAVNNLIDLITLRISLLVENAGYKAYPVSSSQSVGSRYEFKSSFSHKIAGTLSGAGTIGKSGLFIHKSFGPRVRLGTVLTDAPLLCGVPIQKGECGKCSLCFDACPASAIKGSEWEAGADRKSIYDPLACSEFIKAHFSHIGKGHVCGICMKICPKGKAHNKSVCGDGGK